MSEYRYEPPVPPYGSPERGDQKCPVPLAIYVDDHLYRECPRCEGYGGWEKPDWNTLGWNHNIAPDPQYTTWVDCPRCDGAGEVRR